MGVSGAISGEDRTMTETLQNTQAEIIEGLKEILKRPAQLDATTNIVRDLQLDSLAVMDFIMSLEDRFEIVIPLDRVAEVETLGDLARVVDQLRGRN
ncbi:MAG TPA: acyl carrier protein [Nevskia sp.]|nr:acyl carrier protein [Nevskia sp.]